MKEGETKEFVGMNEEDREIETDVQNTNSGNGQIMAMDSSEMPGDTVTNHETKPLAKPKRLPQQGAAMADTDKRKSKKVGQDKQSTHNDEWTRDSNPRFEDIALKKQSYADNVGPDRGIIWPRTMNELNRQYKAYFVEQFLKSQLFRQRFAWKHQGSNTWMKGLSPFQLWVLEHEGTPDIKSILRPVPKRENRVKARVNCWRSNATFHENGEQQTNGL